MNLIESRIETMIRDEPVKNFYHHFSSLWLSSWKTNKTQDISGVLILHKATKRYRKLKFDSLDIAEDKFLEFVRNLLKSCCLNWYRLIKNQGSSPAWRSREKPYRDGKIITHLVVSFSALNPPTTFRR